MKGAKVAAIPKTLISKIRRIVARSLLYSVSVPDETPALATTTSGAPKRARKRPAALASAAASATSSA
jgi:hypothetical protein